MSTVKEIMSQDSYWQINKKFAKTFGIEAALIMSYLVDNCMIHNTQEWVFRTACKIEEDTSLSRYKQTQALKILEQNGFIEKKLMGQPAKLHFKIFENKISNFFKTGFEKTSKQDFKILENSYNKNITNKNITNKNLTKNNKVIIDNVRQNFLPDPSIEIEPINGQEKKEKPSPPPRFRTEVSLIVNYLNDVTGRNFDPEASSNAKFIRARLKDGATVEEMKHVIDFKAREWLENKKMAQYLRPKTLFNKTKFSDYLEQIENSSEKSEATKRLRNVVNEFVERQNMVFSWDVAELESLEKIAARLKGLMKERGDPMTMDHLETVLMQMLMRMDKFYKKNFSLKLINSNLNKILNGAKDNKEAEWEAFMASIN